MDHPENSSEYAGLQVNSGVEQPSIINPYLKRNRFRRRELSVGEMVEGILKGDVTILSQAVTLIESVNPDHQARAQEVINKCLPYSGHSIRIVSAAEFGRALASAMSDPSRSMAVSGLITYSSSDARLHEYIKTDNTFTVKALYRLGFKWPITDEPYMTRMIDALDTLGYFDREDM